MFPQSSCTCAPTSRTLCRTGSVCLRPAPSRFGTPDTHAATNQKSGLRPHGAQVPRRTDEPGRPTGRQSAVCAKTSPRPITFRPSYWPRSSRPSPEAGILVSHAGTNGGYALARPATEITAFEVIRAIDGPLFITSCITIHGTCDLPGHCTIKEPLRKVNDSIKDLLSGIRIADLIEASDTEPPASKARSAAAWSPSHSSTAELHNDFQTSSRTRPSGIRSNMSNE